MLDLVLDKVHLRVVSFNLGFVQVLLHCIAELGATLQDHIPVGGGGKERERVRRGGGDRGSDRT